MSIRMMFLEIGIIELKRYNNNNIYIYPSLNGLLCTCGLFSGIVSDNRPDGVYFNGIVVEFVCF